MVERAQSAGKMQFQLDYRSMEVEYKVVYTPRAGQKVQEGWKGGCLDKGTWRILCRIKNCFRYVLLQRTLLHGLLKKFWESGDTYSTSY